MRYRHFLIILVFLFSTFFLAAGDIASFINLGFSQDSKYFMFAQYGLNIQKSASYGELYLVDIGKNVFVQNGTKTKEYLHELQPGQDGIGALFNLLSESTAMKSKYAIDHVQQGRFLYILVNGDAPKPRLEFRDFVSGKTYKVDLVQSTRGSGNTVSSSFYIQLNITGKDGKIDGYTVGRADYMRSGVKQYRVRQILLSPDEKSLIFVMEKEHVTNNDTSIRYMVETITLR